MTMDIVENTVKQDTSIPGGFGGRITPIRTTERAREVAEKRWGAYRKAAERGMVAGVLGENVTVTKAAKVMAYSDIVQKQAEAALTLSDNGTANTAAARFVRDAIGADVGAPSRGNNEQSITNNTVNITVTVSAGASLMRIAGGDDE